MTSSRFPLQAVLRWREQREASEERALLALQAQLFQLRAAIASLDQELALGAVKRAERIHQMLFAADLLAEAAQRQALLARRADLLQQQRQAEQAIAAQQAAYLTARQGREMLDTLKAEHNRDWHAAQEASEAKRLDEIFAARRQPLR